MNTVTITLNQNQVELKKGLTEIKELYESSDTDFNEKRLYLNKLDDIDIPLLPDEYIIIHGGENIFSDDINSEIDDNPSVRKPINFMFNDKEIKQGLEKAKINSNEISCRDEEVESPGLFVDVLGTVDERIPDNVTLVTQDNDAYLTVPVSDDGAIDLEECSKKDRRPPKGQKYKIKIDRKSYIVEEQKLTGIEILGLVEKNYSEWSLNQKLRGGRRKAIESDEIVDLSQEGIERFETVMQQAQQGKSV